AREVRRPARSPRPAPASGPSRRSSSRHLLRETSAPWRTETEQELHRGGEAIMGAMQRLPPFRRWRNVDSTERSSDMNRVLLVSAASLAAAFAATPASAEHWSDRGFPA